MRQVSPFLCLPLPLISPSLPDFSFLIFLLCAHTWLWVFSPHLTTMVAPIFKQEYSKEWQKSVLNFCVSFIYLFYAISQSSAQELQFCILEYEWGEPIFPQPPCPPAVTQLWEVTTDCFEIFFPVIPCYCCYYLMLAVLSHFYTLILPHGEYTGGKKAPKPPFQENSVGNKSQIQNKSIYKNLQSHHWPGMRKISD